VLDIRTLCLDVKGDLSAIIGEALESFLTGPDLDLQVVQVGDDPCDAVLTVILTATPLGANYVPTWYTPSPDDLLGLATAQQRCYNGAAVEGQMSLALPGRASAQVPISGKKSPPPDIGACLDKGQAPFGKVWPRAVLNGLAHFWGSEVYVQAVAHPGSLSRADTGLVREAASFALKERSGQDFGTDADLWQQWWEKRSEAEKPFELPMVTPSLTPTSTPTPSPGGITGLALYEDGQPAAGVTVILYQITGPESRGELPFLIVEPRAIADDDGRFTISGVPPGTYVARAPRFVHSAGVTGHFGVPVTPVDLAPGQTVDVGTITAQKQD
jgi:hypothetical protein